MYAQRTEWSSTFEHLNPTRNVLYIYTYIAVADISHMPWYGKSYSPPFHHDAWILQKLVTKLDMEYSVAKDSYIAFTDKSLRSIK